VATEQIVPAERRQADLQLEARLIAGKNKPVPHGTFRSLGLGLITGAADDDPSAIGTYASAGASLVPLCSGLRR
jgi:hypothetical protein